MEANQNVNEDQQSSSIVPAVKTSPENKSPETAITIPVTREGTATNTIHYLIGTDAGMSNSSPFKPLTNLARSVGELCNSYI